MRTGALLLLALALACLPALAAEPAYPHGAFRADCSLCHQSGGWSPAQVSKKFDHGQYGLPLEGAHARVACRACHASLDFARANPECVSCHQDVHRGELGTDCVRCHTPRSFIDRAEMVRSHLETRFPLTGAHLTQDCEDCHVPAAQGQLQYVNTPIECVSCHRNAYNAATDPNHVTAGFPTDCVQCHVTVAWSLARFDHNATRFPLTGAHRTTPCASCHGDGVYQGKSTLCVSCHLADYNGTTDPNHQAAGFSTSCETCHTTTSWNSTFDHNATQFPLTGAHRTVACASCHGDGVYNGKSTLCVSCHLADYNGTTDPNHQAAGFSTTCETCHTTTSWNSAFDHNATQFPLTGAHVATPCASCHGDGVYNGKSTLCVSCHLADYNGTTDPNHQAAGFSTTCETCHTTTSWSSTFDHNATQFPLTGAHRTVACASCHGDGVYNGKSTLCVSCHLADYNGTTDPNHQQAGFSTSCETCHTTTSWDSTFDHNATQFPLTGAHVTTPCASCHGDGVYNGKSTLCVSCHLADYNGTNDPNHQSAGYPTTCETCHSTTTWDGARDVNHDANFFPIYSGKHQGKWSTCADCHTQPTNFAEFNCLQCHEHSDKAKVDGDHRGVNGYAYESHACYGCHPDGRSD